MINNQIKSILRNRENYIYIVVLSVLFIALNIALNLQGIIDSFYDSQILKKSNDFKMTEMRTIYVTDGYFVLTEDLAKEFNNIKHVENVQVYAKYENSKELCYITVDDWKNIEYVQNVIDKKGINTSRIVGGMGIDSLYQSYSEISIITKIVKIIIMVSVLSVFMLCYKNILNNEKENMKLLNIMGYNNRKRRLIVYAELLTLTFIGIIISTIILAIVLYIVNKNNLKISLNEVKNVIINIVVIAISLFICTESYFKVKDKN